MRGLQIMTEDEMHEDIVGVTEEPLRQLSGHTIVFLRLALLMWAQNAPETSIRGVHWSEALAPAAHATGKTYAPRDLAPAAADLDVVQDRLRAARLANGG